MSKRTGLSALCPAFWATARPGEAASTVENDPDLGENIQGSRWNSTDTPQEEGEMMNYVKAGVR